MLLTGKTNKKRRMNIFLVFFHEEHQQYLNSSQIITKAQSTISICALLIFLTLLLFTLSSFEPNNTFSQSRSPRSYSQTTPRPNPHALQRLGTLYTQGTTAMNNLVLCHVTESVTTKQLKLFLRVFHRSGLPSNSDLLFLFNSISTPDSFNNVILQENDFFLTVLLKCENEVTDKRDPIWGRRVKSENSSLHDCGNGSGNELTQMSYGSVVGFGVSELDPENSLSGFLDDQVPISLRRWAAYPMILGRVRRHYKYVMLVDVNKVLLLGDPLGRVKNLSPDSVLLSSTRDKTINPAVIMGGVRGIRRLSAAMLTEIVRADTTQQHNKRNNVVTESSLLGRLATNEFTRRSISIVTFLVEASSLSESWIANQTMVWRENNETDIDSVVMKHICSFSVDPAVYTDC